MMKGRAMKRFVLLGWLTMSAVTLPVSAGAYGLTQPDRAVSDMGFAVPVPGPAPVLVTAGDGSAVVVPVETPTPVPEGDVSGALTLLPTIVKAFAEGKYALGAAAVLMLLVFAVRTFLWKSVPKKYVPLVTAGLAAASAVAGALWVGVDPVKAVLDGLTVGISAVGLWELAKPLLKKSGG